MLGEQIRNYIRELKQKHFEVGDKPDKLLSRQLKDVQADRAIHKISSATGQLITDPKLINDRLFDYFNQLYTSKSNPTDSARGEFFDALNIPTLNESAKIDLDSDLTLEEIKTAIHSFPNGKVCGPDGFGIEFYKKNMDKVAPLLLRMINCSVEDGVFPSSISDAQICLLLKTDRDGTNVASYPPLSFLNSDQKIIAKVLTNRLNVHVGLLIHPDQTGFIPDRFLFSNRRTRQGCSLSHLLFAFALEPLAISIRSYPEITGIGHGVSDSPIGRYADDVILTLSDIRVSLTPLLNLIKNFGQLSGFTINWEKSLFIPLCNGINSASLNDLPFKVSTDSYVSWN